MNTEANRTAMPGSQTTAPEFNITPSQFSAVVARMQRAGVPTTLLTRVGLRFFSERNFVSAHLTINKVMFLGFSKRNPVDRPNWRKGEGLALQRAIDNAIKFFGFLPKGTPERPTNARRQ